MDKKVAILIPCYNEEKTIQKVIQDYKRELPNAVIYVYDNNSTDKTYEIAKNAGAIVKKESRQGKGNVIRSMFREITADAYLMIDGDDTYPAEYAKQMVLEIIEENTDMVIGDRLSSTYFTQNKRPFHNSGNRLVRKLINIIFKNNVMDILTGYRAFSYDFVKTFPVISKGFEIETEMTIHALDKNLKISEIEVQYRDRPTGSESKLNTYSDGMKVLLKIFNLFKEYRPLLFFSIFAVLFGIIGITSFSIAFSEFLRTGIVSKIPTLIMSVLFITLCILSFMSGVILDVLAKKHKQLFEVNLNIIRQLREEK